MGELTNKIRKMVVSLADVKGRRRENLFVAEGTKCVCDTIDAFRCRYLFATDDWLAQHDDIAARCGEAVTAVTKGDLREMTTLTATPPVIAVYDLPEPAQLDINSLNKTLTLALDRVQDPGQSRHDNPHLRLVWHHHDTCIQRHRRPIQSKDRAIDNGRNFTNQSDILRLG